MILMAVAHISSMSQTLTYMSIMDLDSTTCFMPSLTLDSIQLGVAMVLHPNSYCPARVRMSGGQDKEVLLGDLCKCGGLTPHLSDRGVGTMVTASWDLCEGQRGDAQHS